jgi:hypothetical protein
MNKWHKNVGKCGMSMPEGCTPRLKLKIAVQRSRANRRPRMKTAAMKSKSMEVVFLTKKKIVDARKRQSKTKTTYPRLLLHLKFSFPLRSTTRLKLQRKVRIDQKNKEKYVMTREETCLLFLWKMLRPEDQFFKCGRATSSICEKQPALTAQFVQLGK